MSTRSKLRRDQFLASCARSTRGNVDDRKTNGCKRHCGRISSTDLLGLRTVGKDCTFGWSGNLALLRRGQADGVGNRCRVMLVVTDYSSCAQQPSWRRSRPHHDTGGHSCRDGNVDYDVGSHHQPQPG
jgi:hypothetical protein